MAATFRDADTSHAVQEAPQSPPGLHGAQLGCPPPPPPPPPHGNGEAAPSAACDASEDAEPPPLADTSSGSEDDEPCARRAAVVQQAMPGQEAAAAAVQPLAGARATVRNGGASISRVTAVLHCLDAAAAAAVAAGLDPWFALGVQLQVQVRGLAALGFWLPHCRPLPARPTG